MLKDQVGALDSFSNPTGVNSFPTTFMWHFDGNVQAMAVYLKSKAKHPKCIFEPCHEIMALFVLRKLILQTRMRSHPGG